VARGGATPVIAVSDGFYSEGFLEITLEMFLFVSVGKLEWVLQESQSRQESLQAHFARQARDHSSSVSQRQVSPPIGAKSPDCGPNKRRSRLSEMRMAKVRAAFCPAGDSQVLNSEPNH
jgi:hypothetical protein